MLKVTHLSQRKSACPWPDELEDGWFLRFTGETDEWNALKEELKGFGRTEARWIPPYRWDDGREGAWWVTDWVVEEWCAEDTLSLLHGAMRAIGHDNALQWIKRGRYSYTSSSSDTSDTSDTKQRTRTRSGSATKESTIPVWLREEYSILHLPGTATLNDCKDAYRQLAKVHHPDAGGSHQGFIALQRAYHAVNQYLSRRIAS